MRTGSVIVGPITTTGGDWVIWALLAAGFIAGFIVRLKVSGTAMGCLALLAVPAAMIGYIAIVHSYTRLNSTSALDWFFAPLWPSLGAVVGFSVAWARQVAKR